MQAFMATVAFSVQGQSNQEWSLDIRYMAISEFDAALDAMRWFEARQRAIPEWFYKPLCIKVYRLHLHMVDQDGGLGSETDMPIFEWKCDTAGLPYKQYVDHRLGKRTS